MHFVSWPYFSLRDKQMEEKLFIFYSLHLHPLWNSGSSFKKLNGPNFLMYSRMSFFQFPFAFYILNFWKHLAAASVFSMIPLLMLMTLNPEFPTISLRYVTLSINVFVLYISPDFTVSILFWLTSSGDYHDPYSFHHYLFPILDVNFNHQLWLSSYYL